MEPILTALYIGTMTLTSYRSVPNQTDSSPMFTSIGHHVNPYGAAVSRDLLASGKACYGDILVIQDTKSKEVWHKVVNDCMNQRHRTSVDMWVATYPEEKLIGRRKAAMWVLKSNARQCAKLKRKTKNGY